MVVVALLTLFGALTFAALYSPSVGAQGLSGDATLSALTVNDGTSDVDLNPAFVSAGTSYRTAVKYRGDRLTVTATTTSSNATIVFLDQSGAILDDADLNTPGHQLDVPVGDSIFKIKVAAQDGTAMEYEVVVERDSAYLFGWTPTRDLNGLEAAGNDSPQGIGSDGDTMWVADDDDDKLYAYNLATGVRDASKEFSLHSDNGDPKGVWSDKTTVWVADDGDDKLYAYTLSSGARESSKEFSLHADNGDPAGIWSDGTTIWVANNTGFPRKVFAYTLSGGARDTNKEFVPNWNAAGIWSNGTTMWVVSDVSSSVGNRVEAYTIDLNADGTAGPNHGLRDTDKQFSPRSTVGTIPVGIWSNGKGAVWIADPDSPKVESYNMLSTSAGSTTMSSLTISVGTNDSRLRPAFASNTLIYRTSVTDDVLRVTVSATPSENTAAVTYLDGDNVALEDADPNATDFQVAVREGLTAIQILVTAQDGTALSHWVIVERDSTLLGGRTPSKDVYDLDPVAVAYPRGIWSDGTTMWVTNTARSTVFAYTLATSVRDTSKEFSLHPDNDNPWGIWSDGTTVWVLDRTGHKLYAYTLATGARDANQDFTMHNFGNTPEGIWSDGTTMWIGADSYNDGAVLYAYTLATGARDIAKEFVPSANSSGPSVSGIWSNGTTLWVADFSADTLFAYTLATGAPDPARDITLSQRASQGVWGDGTTIWVADSGLAIFTVPKADHRIFSYRVPPSSPGTVSLSDLTVSPSPPVPSFTAELRPEFSFARNSSYRVVVPSSRVTVSAPPNNSMATQTFLDANGEVLTDADPGTAGFQVDVGVGETAINIRLATGAVSLIYRVVVERDSTAFYGWTPAMDLNNLLRENPALGGDAIRGLWADDTTLYVTAHHVPKVFAYTRATGARDASKDIATNQGSRATSYGFKTGIWSDGTTMWVLNYGFGEANQGPEGLDGTGKVFAFKLSDGARDTTKEFPLDLETSSAARGIWSDGTTVWVSDWMAAKLFAYTLATGARHMASDITLHHLNDSAQGIWSDGTTIWVAQWNSLRMYAYTLSTGVYDPDKSFDRAPGNLLPRDIWSDGATMWVPDATARKIFSYRMPPDGTTTDPPGVTVSPTALTVTEEDTAGESYRVVLDSQPTADVTVTVAGHAGTEVTPSPASLTFTRSNWETDQTVTVTAGSDADTVNDTVTLTHSAASTDSNYQGITIASVTVTVTDDDIDTTAGICGRTEEVRDALVELIPGVSDCAAVTAADLAAITDPLNLSGQNITALAAGDFAGLTALIELYLNNNGLTTLPEDVFAGLTSLKVLTLYYNELTTLPDGVFGQLTALNFLYLGDNPRAPFAPTAVARPDAGTVPVAGGTVTLDGSGSGGPWGTNVTYRWALTTPASGVRVTFDDSTSATPEATIPTLAAGTELTFTLTVTGRGGTDGIETATATARVTATQNITNNPPVFAGGAVQARTFDETIGDATVGAAADIGTPVSATDPDTGDTLEYSLLGADRDKFTFDTSSGQIKTRAGESYDYEARTSYSVTVAVNDGTVTVSSAVTINVTDQDEPPPVMNQPVVTATANSTTSLEVSWTEPSNPGRPDIEQLRPAVPRGQHRGL